MFENNIVKIKLYKINFTNNELKDKIFYYNKSNNLIYELEY